MWKPKKLNKSMWQQVLKRDFYYIENKAVHDFTLKDLNQNIIINYANYWC